MSLTPEQRDQLDTLLAKVRQNGMRKTRALVEVLQTLLASGSPLSINDLLQAGGLAGVYEMPTISRLLNRLEQADIVQRLGFRDRAAYFTLRIPNRHHDYLICRECGTIETLEIACPVRDLEAKIASQHKFTEVYHELEFYGICPACN